MSTANDVKEHVEKGLLMEMSKTLTSILTPLSKDIHADVKIPVLLERTRNFLHILGGQLRLLVHIKEEKEAEKCISHYNAMLALFDKEVNIILQTAGDNAPFEANEGAKKGSEDFSDEPTEKSSPKKGGGKASAKK